MKPALQSGRTEARREVIRGTAEQIIRVRVPVPGLFREAVFFLHEDVLRRSDLSREELMRQARRSAEEYLRPLIPERKTKHWLLPLLVLAGMSLGFGLGVLIGI